MKPDIFNTDQGNQQRDATLADLDHALGAALAEAPCTERGCRFVNYVTGCYYDINGENDSTVGMRLVD